ncbi:MAG: TonB-dependent receptor [Sulfurimonas sp.]|nr:TonB-dependent receptor [Sulfurimonas sp.]
MQKKIQLSLISVALISSLHAQEIKLKPLTIESTAIQTDELRSTDAVEVYTQEDIEKAHVQNVYEFLNTQTSVFTTSGYGNPFVQKIDMRGYGVGDGHQNIVVTINGRRMNNVDMTPQLLSSISPSSISKIEIIKSSGIVVGGDGANAGVINITTKKNNDKEFTLSMGSYGLFSSSFYAGHSDDKLSASLNGEIQKNDGVRHIDSEGNKDENKFSTFNLNLAYKLTDKFELHAGASTTHTDVIYAGSMTQDEYNKNPTQQGSVDYGWGASPSSSTHQTYDSNVLSVGTTYYINDNLSLNADISQEKKESNYITYNSVYNYDYKSGKISLDYLSDAFSLVAGVDGFDGKMAKQSTTIELTKTNKAGFVMSEVYLDKLTLKAGYRYEKTEFDQKDGENKKDSLNGAELGVNYSINKEQSIFANYSRSYQTASLDRLVSFFTGLYTGYVEPSKANNYTVGYNNITPNNKLKISLFYADLKNEIYYYADPTFMNSKNTNIDKSHKYGLDLYDKFLINEEFNVAMNYSYVQAIIDKEIENGENYAGKDLPGVSDHNLKATLSYLPNSNTTISLTQIYRSSAYAANDFNNNFTQKQEAYKSTDISIAYVTKGYEVFAKINNLFNQKNGLWIKDDAIYPVNFTTTAMAGFKLKF